MKHILALLVLLLPLPGRSAELKIATWNLDWLTTRAAGDSFNLALAVFSLVLGREPVKAISNPVG